MQTNKFILIPAYIIYAIIEAGAVAVGIAALALAAELSNVGSHQIIDSASKIIALLIGLTVSWLILIRWRTGTAKRIITAILVAIGTYAVSVAAAMLIVQKSLGL